MHFLALILLTPMPACLNVGLIGQLDTLSLWCLLGCACSLSRSFSLLASYSLRSLCGRLTCWMSRQFPACLSVLPCFDANECWNVLVAWTPLSLALMISRPFFASIIGCLVLLTLDRTLFLASVLLLASMLLLGHLLPWTRLLATMLLLMVLAAAALSSVTLLLPGSVPAFVSSTTQPCAHILSCFQASVTLCRLMDQRSILLPPHLPTHHALCLPP